MEETAAKNKPLLLELFSGTGSIGRAFRAQGWDVISVDIDPKTDADIKTDILQFEASKFLDRKVDVVWSSPCCTKFSKARNNKSTETELCAADALVRKSLEIARELGAPIFLENPESGKLKTRGILDHLNMRTIDYCKWVDWGYRKRTAIWSDTDWEPSRPLRRYDCSSTMSGFRRHKAGAQQGSPGPCFTRNELYRIPPELCNEIASYCTRLLTAL